MANETDHQGVDGEKMIKNLERDGKNFTIENAERLFALRNFRQALQVANEVMILSITTKPANDYNNGGGDGNGLEEYDVCDETILKIDFSNISLLQKQRHQKKSREELNGHQHHVKVQDSLHPPSSHTATNTATTSDQLDNNHDDVKHSSLLTRVCIVPQNLLMLNTVALCSGNDNNNRPCNNHNVRKDTNRKTTATATATATRTLLMGKLLQDRAAAIVLQSSYELWRERRNRRRHRRSSSCQVSDQARLQFTPSGEEEEEEIYMLRRDLKFFLKLYHNRLDSQGLTGEGGENSIVMSWDLAILWIKFCNALGYTDVVLSSLIKLLHGLVCWDKTTGTHGNRQHYHCDKRQPLIKNGNRNQLSDEKKEEKDIYLRQSYYELCHLLLVKNAIYIKDIMTLECIIDAIFLREASNISVLSLLHQRRTATTEITTKRGEKSKDHVGCKKCQQVIIVKVKPVREAIHVLCQNMEAILDLDVFYYKDNDDGRDEQCKERVEGHLAPPIGERAYIGYVLALMEALEDCLEDIRDIEEKMAMKQKGETRQQSSIPLKQHPCDNKILRHHQNNQDHERGSPNGERKEIRGEGRGEKIKNYVVDSLWISEDRWINRGKVFTASLIMYSSWRRRKRAFAVGHGARKVLLSPLREIIDALTSK